MRFSKYNKAGRVIFYDLECRHDLARWLVVRTWGQLGGKVKTKTKRHATQEAALRDFGRAKADLLRKGYREQIHRGDNLAYQADYWIRHCWDWFLKRRKEPLPEEWPHEFTFFVRELFANLYEEAEELDEPVAWAVALHTIAFTLLEWDQLRNTVYGDRWDAAVAAVRVGEALWKSLPKQPGKGQGEAAQAAMEALEALAQDADQATAAMATALRNAVHAAAEDAERVERLLGWSPDGVGHGKAHDTEEKARLANLLVKRPEVLHLAKTLGRVQTIVSKVLRGPHEAPPELTSVTTGADLARTLPVELARMKHPALRKDFLRRFLERTTAVYEVKDDTTLGAGPFVACVDVSGSMGASADRWAKALAIAFAQIAREQRRKAAILTFDTQVRGTYDCSQGLTVKDLARLIDDRAGGGTDFSVPLKRASELVGEWGENKTDIVLITDGGCYLGDQWLDQWKLWRDRTGVHCVCLIVGSQMDPDPRLYDVCLHADRFDQVAADQLTRTMLARRNQ